MPARLQIAPEEYLSTSFEGTDREYVRGEVVERSMPNYVHGKIQALVSFPFLLIRRSHRLFVCSETRMRLAPDLIRIPDIAVFADIEPEEPVPSYPPLVVIEIISPDDRYSEVLDKLAEYQQWGVPHIWVVNPQRKSLAIYDAGAIQPVSLLTLPGYPLELSNDLFE